MPTTTLTVAPDADVPLPLAFACKEAESAAVAAEQLQASSPGAMVTAGVALAVVDAVVATVATVVKVVKVEVLVVLLEVSVVNIVVAFTV